MNNHNVRVSCRAVICKGNELFLVRQKHIERNNEINEFWCTVGGGLNPDESLKENLIREIHEELGVDRVDIGRLLYVMQYEGYGNQHIEFFFEVINVHDFENIQLENTTHGINEISEYGFVDPAKVTVKPELLVNTIKELDNSNTVWPIFKSYL